MMENYAEIVQKQNIFFNSNKTKDISFRIAQLKKLKQVLIQNEKELAQAIYNDFKKSFFEMYATELALVHVEIKTAIKDLKKWAKPKVTKTNLANFPSKCYITPEPLGTTLIIGAWNYPYQLSLSPTVAAIAAGNTVILKPSELAVNTSKILKELINSNFNADFFTVIEGGAEVVTELLNQKFDKIFYTGSVAVGKIIYQAAAKNLIPVTLELGGKSPVIILPDCNFKITAKRLVWAKFINAGQTCLAPDYILVHRSIEKDLLFELKGQLIKWFKNVTVESENYVQIINERHFDRLLSLIDEPKIYYGGKSDRNNRFIEPTILHNISFDDKVMQDEIFGPILPVISYDEIDQAIAYIKSKPKPLACYIFTLKKDVQRKILNEVSFGGGCINDAIMHVSNENLPFGGVGNSGIGNYHGIYGFKTFSHYKSIFEKPILYEIPVKYPPYSALKLKIIKWFMG
jgi:aldehyde dehydrogenase (NAD+)